MKILHVVQKLDFNWGGLSLFVAEIAKAQANAGHQVSVFTEAPQTALCHTLGDARCCDDSSNVLKSLVESADLVHIHGLWLPLYNRASRLAIRAKKPYVLSPHGMLEPAAMRFSKWRKRIAWHLFQSRVIERAAMLHATAASERATLRNYGVQPIVEASPAAHLAELNSSSASNQPRNALYLGRLHPIKGIDLLIDAWLAVAPIGWRLQIVGPDEAHMKDQLQRHVTKQNVDVDIQWLGAVFGEQKDKLLAHSNLVIVPSRSENFAITVVEALASASPVIATTATPWKHLGELGFAWICEPSVESLSSAIGQACSLSGQKLCEMGKAGRDWVRENYSWSASSEKLVSAYNWALNSGTKPEHVFVD